MLILTGILPKIGWTDNMNKSRLTFVFCINLILINLYSCKCTQVAVSDSEIEECKLEKVKFDLNEIDEQGLLNKVAVDFEFCILNQQKYIDEVIAIDASLKQIASKGRSKCSKDQVLIIGNSSNKEYKKILCKISQLTYVKEINRTYWE